MADHWIGISSTHYDSHCGDEGGYTVEQALDGTNIWWHPVDEVHWFILDLVQTYTIKKVRGRSNQTDDPKFVTIYVSDSKVDWGIAVYGSANPNWEDRLSWGEINTVEKNGRYIKVQIDSTEDPVDRLNWGDSPAFTIFDAYGDIYAPPPPAVLRPTAAVGNPLIFQILSTFGTPMYRRKPRLRY